MVCCAGVQTIKRHGVLGGVAGIRLRIGIRRTGAVYLIFHPTGAGLVGLPVDGGTIIRGIGDSWVHGNDG